jgi:hypothetical protein
MSAMPGDTIGSSVNELTTKKSTRMIVVLDAHIGALTRARARVMGQAVALNRKPIKEGMPKPPRGGIGDGQVSGVVFGAAVFAENQAGKAMYQSKRDTGESVCHVGPIG